MKLSWLELRDVLIDRANNLPRSPLNEDCGRDLESIKDVVDALTLKVNSKKSQYFGALSLEEDK